MATNKISTPSVLAFESKLACSDAILSAGDWNDRDSAANWQSVLVTEKAVRGTISNRQKKAIASDPAKLDAEIQKANLQTVDTAALPFNCDTLQVRFSLRVLGGLETPSTCNSPEYQEALSVLIRNYISENGFKEIASRYASNIASGRFLWRNRVGAENVEVCVAFGNKTWTFDGLSFPLHNFEQRDDVQELAQAIENGLKGEANALLQVSAFTQLGAAQTVFPSQELVLEKGDNKSKYLYQLSGVAAMHSQKIGNALRTIDTWHSEAEEVGAIAVEPFGSVTNRGKAYRQPKEKLDFYTLLDNWILKGNAPVLDQQHYVMAMFIRGGVFGE